MEFSDRDKQHASRIIEGLFEGYGERLDLELENNLVVSDLEMDVNTFSTELFIANDFDLGIPALRIGGDERYLIPISVISTGFPYGKDFRSSGASRPLRERRWWRRNRYIYEWYRLAIDWESRDYYDQRAEKRIISPDEAREAFTGRAINFLAFRIAAVRNFSRGETEGSEEWGTTSSLNLPQNYGGRTVTTPGCNFSVSTNSNGLRVFWSGAYYIAPNYFSHPTSPVTSVLQAGSYIFGIDGGAYGNEIRWDTNAVTSLPGKPSIHLNY